MPIDVTSGVVDLFSQDISIPGRVDLAWDRRYSSAQAALSPTSFGLGWSNGYFAKLRKNNTDFLFSALDDSVEIFTDPQGVLENSGVIRNPGAFQELSKSGDRYILSTWNVETGRIKRYVFKEGENGESWPVSSIEDAMGQGLDILRNDCGRLTAIRQRAEKRTLSLEYDSNNQISAVFFMCPGGRQQRLARYEYDTSARLIAAYDARGYADRYEYNADSRISREILKDGGVFYFKYDRKGRCVRTSGLERYDEKSLCYLEGARWTEVTDSQGNTTRYQYRLNGQVINKIDPMGGEWRTQYDELGRIVAKIDPMGGVTKYEFDQFGNRNRIVNALGRIKEVVFNDSHLPVKIISPTGAYWEREYDSSNRLVATKDAEGNRWVLSYDEAGRLRQVITANGDVLRQSYDTSGQLSEVIDWEGHRTQFSFDTYGRLSEEIDPLEGKRSFHYDLLGNLIRLLYPDGSHTECVYDSGGNLTRITDRKGNVACYHFGPCRRLLERTDRLGNITRLLWGTEPGQLNSVINSKGEEYLFRRDACGNITEEIGFDDRRLQFEHDPNGNRIAFVSGSNERIVFKRDPLGRLLQSVPQDGSSITFTYDEAGQLKSSKNSDIEIRFERDRNGRLSKEWQGNEFIEHQYDAVGSRVLTKTSLGQEIRYKFDGNGLLSSINLNEKHSFDFFRNPRGDETRRKVGRLLTLDQSINELGQIVEQRIVESSSNQPPIIKRSYVYDKSDVVSIADNRWGITELTYDASEHLERFVCGPFTYQFTYDTTGNLSSILTNGSAEKLLHGKGDRLLHRDNVIFEYDGNGRLVKKGPDGGEWKYSWNSLGQLTSVVRPDRAIWEYKYDPFGRRISKSGPGVNVQFLWDRDAVIHEIHHSTFASTPSKVTWIFHPHNLTPVAKLEGSKVFAAFVDQIGAPRELVDIQTSKVVWTAKYGPFGEIHDVVGDVKCPVRFQGQYHDEESGLYYNRFRYYDPSCGRFISADPVRLAGGYNLFAFAQNVWNWIDPFGLGSSNLFRGDDNYSGGPIGLPLGSDADVKDPMAQTSPSKSDETSIYTSFSEDKAGADKFTKDDNVFKVKTSDLDTLAGEGKIRIITPENVGEEMDRIGGFSEKDKRNVAATMKRNKEVLVEGEIPEEMVKKCK